MNTHANKHTYIHAYIQSNVFISIYPYTHICLCNKQI